MKNFNEVEHQEEIRQSRVGGFGGSDAGLFLRIANNGVVVDNETLAGFLYNAIGDLEQAVEEILYTN